MDVCLGAIEKQSAIEIDSEGLFLTPGEATEYYRKKLMQFKSDSFKSIFNMFGAPIDEQLENYVLTIDPVLAAFATQAGSLKKVETCRVRKLGKSIQRVGYLLVYERNIAFVEIWLLDCPEAEKWRVFNLNFLFDPDTKKTMQTIPEIFYNE